MGRGVRLGQTGFLSPLVKGFPEASQNSLDSFLPLACPVMGTLRRSWRGEMGAVASLGRRFQRGRRPGREEGLQHSHLKIHKL